MRAYPHNEIEAKWREKWLREEAYRAPDNDPDRENAYYLVEFPYPSGDIHVGHWYAFSVTDIAVRQMRMKGKNVLFPIGFDAFGLPAENAAIKNKVSPAEWTTKNMETMTTQLQATGASFDWSRMVATCTPEYYRWTQWIFSQFYRKGLAYRGLSSVNWCPKDQTVLANEQVVSGACDRCGAPIEAKQMTQWMFKITDYAEQLLKGLGALPWKEEIKDAQRNWIGKSTGARISFPLRYFSQTHADLTQTNADTNELNKKESATALAVFTTRADTMYGATFLVIGPEHVLLQNNELGIVNDGDVQSYITEAAKRKTEDRFAAKEKTGVRLEGVVAVNPATGKEIPVFVADYVLGDVGTGAIMAVPAHDERDYEFAKAFHLPIIPVVLPPHENVVGVGVIIDCDGKILLQQRDNNTNRDPGMCAPFGGACEAGESTISCATRELHEELSTDIDPAELQYIGDYASHNTLGTSIRMFSLSVSEVPQRIHEGTAIRQFSLDEALASEEVTEFTKEILRSVSEPSQCFTSLGVLVNSGECDGLTSPEATEKILANVGGSKETQYRLHDWILSRQRYWGVPIPVVYDPEGKAHLVKEEHLPWMLPTDVEFLPTGESPLKGSKELRDRVTKLYGEGWTPEFDTMDTFVDSSWYFLRYTDPKNTEVFADREKMNAWLPVQLYSGGAEHTTMHVLYSRFFMQALFDLGLVPYAEPYVVRRNRGIILGPDGQKMSKSKGNVINPDEYVAKLGSDAVRMYLAFIGPYDEAGSYPWSVDSILGVRRFLDRVWKYAEEWMASAHSTGSGQATGDETTQILHESFKRVTESIEGFAMNTGVSQLMILFNHLTRENATPISKNDWESVVRLLAPYAPHMTEEIWEGLGHTTSVHFAPWPTHDEVILARAKVTVAVQVNGRVRDTLVVSADAGKEELEMLALASEKVKKVLDGKAPKKVIVVVGRVVNIVVKE